METRNLRLGDYVQDEYGYIFPTDLNLLQFARSFSPVPLTEKHIIANRFTEELVEGQKVYFNNPTHGILVTIRRNDTKWHIEVKNWVTKFVGDIEYLHELQHVLLDCGLTWKVVTR